MTLSMSSASLPVCTRMLTNLSHILSKAEQFVEAKKIDPTALTTYRLAPDMFPFTRQVLIDRGLSSLPLRDPLNPRA
jgi:hypothetical protein